MRRALPVIALAVTAVACKSRPVIDSFTVDEPNPDARAPVQFSYSVRGASTIRIDPMPGVVGPSPVTVVPFETATYTLRAFNDSGVEATRLLPITIRAPFEVVMAEASPGQVSPGMALKLSWVTSSAERASLTNGTTGEVTDVAPNGYLVVRPSATTIYTLTAYNRPGRLPDSRTAKMTARVAPTPTVSDFIATPTLIKQGETSTLTWKGNAVSYSVTATPVGGSAPPPLPVGPRRSLVVRPTVTTTYTLQAAGPGGTLPTPLAATVKVDPNPSSALTYTPATPAPGQALKLVADGPCGPPCTMMTFRIVVGAADVPLRGLAFDLPLDTSKVVFNPTSFGTGPKLPCVVLPSLAGDCVARATLGSGILKDVLVIGIATMGTGTAPAVVPTLNPGDEVAHFTLVLQSVGGVGPVFDGLASPPIATYKASIQRASGRSAGAIAVGRLDAQ